MTLDINPERESPPKLEIFMMRHGQPEFPDGRRYIYGRTDYPLSPAGVKQARRMGEVLSVVNFQKIISSDLERAVRTAEIVAETQTGGCEITRDPELREIDMGEWDGRTKDEIEEKYAAAFRDRGLDLENTAAPGGETFSEMRKRAMRAFERIIGESAAASRILIVAHGAVMWGIVSCLFDMRIGDIFRFGLDYCALHLIEYSRVERAWGRFRLVRYNWSPDIACRGEDIF
jgi:broad specificity phosphatase PhoE